MINKKKMYLKDRLAVWKRIFNFRVNLAEVSKPL